MTQNRPYRDTIPPGLPAGAAIALPHTPPDRYERAKHAATIRALPPRRFRAGLQIGCSTGELTGRLAKKCAAMHGVDCADAALETARIRYDSVPDIRFTQMTVPAEWPVGHYDLIVLSNLLNCLPTEELRQCAGRVCASLAETGLVILVTHLDKAAGGRSGDAAAACFIAAASALELDLQLRYRYFRIDRLRRAQ